jgi:hypothetical protein
VGPNEKAFHHRGTEKETEKEGLAETLSIGKNYTIALKSLTAMAI